ncbi:MAG: hypothetical protein QOG01_3204 [Pseudonocardiales bacterium]|jgi:hypothetical protein|nr:hypothetical protein [Pseudonocardiales bacterium]
MRLRFMAGCAAACLVLVGCSSSGGNAPKSSSSLGNSPAATAVATEVASSSSAPLSSTAAESSTPATGASALAGRWQGTYQSKKFSSTAGDFTVTFTQQDSTINGSIVIHPSCITAGTVSGTITGTTIAFGQVQGSRRAVAFSGTVNGNNMHGTYHSDAACGDDNGTWTAARS